MSNVAEFIEIRENIEALARQITTCLEQVVVQDARQHLEEANKQLEVLKGMVDNDVQVIVSGRLSRQLASLGAKVETMATKRPARKTPAATKSTGAKTAGKKLKTPAKPASTEPPEIVVFERP